MNIEIEVRARLAAGITDDEIAEDLGIPAQEVALTRVKIVKDETDRFAGSSEETFGLFAAFMSEKIRELGIVVDGLKDPLTRKIVNGAAATAAIGAIKAQADIYDRVIKRGEELGLVQKEANGSFSIVGMDDTEIASEIHRRLVDTQKLLGVYGQSKSIADVEVAAPPAMPTPKSRSAAMARFHRPSIPPSSTGTAPAGPTMKQIVRKASLPAPKV